MPKRSERFLWVHSKGADATSRARITGELRTMVARWEGGLVQIVDSVEDRTDGNGLWLCNVDISNESNQFAKIANRELKNAVDAIKRKSGIKSLRRRTNLPTPLLMQPIEYRGRKIDLGLHPVNDPWNGMLVLFAYHEGRVGRHSPPHWQQHDVIDFGHVTAQEWKKRVCGCRSRRACGSCKGMGCFTCFESACHRCEGTGWKEYSRWTEGGYRVDYRTGYPIAMT